MQRHWIHAWLLLTPAFVFLVAFTHLPAVTTLWNSLYTTPRGRRPSRWAGLDNYDTLIADPIFWKVLGNNLWFALGTIPTSIAIALAMALWVNERLIGRGFVRMAYFTPTVLPMIAVANIWMFFYTPGFGLIDQITGLFRHGSVEHPWPARYGPDRGDDRHDLERSRLFHDLLPRGPADHPAES